MFIMALEMGIKKQGNIHVYKKVSFPLGSEWIANEKNAGKE